MTPLSFQELVARSLVGEATDSEKAQLEAMLAANSNLRRNYEELLTLGNILRATAPGDCPAMALAPSEAGIPVPAQAKGASAQGNQPLGALQDFCEMFWHPVYAFIRKTGTTSELAEDLTKAFFARLAAPGAPMILREEGQNLRSWLLSALKAFLLLRHPGQAIWRRYRSAPAQGWMAGTPAYLPPEKLDRPGTHAPTPETEFDREWALALLKQALIRLSKESHEPSVAELYDQVFSDLPGQSHTFGLTRVAAAQEITPDDTTRRLDPRVEQLFREQIRATVPTPADVDEELRYLMSVLHPTDTK
jgi:hypothetical protein